MAMEYTLAATGNGFHRFGFNWSFVEAIR